MNTGYASAHWFLSLIPACVKWRTYFSQSFKMLCGVRQGGVLSPYLFAVYTSISEGCSHESWIHFKGICIIIFMYADDTLVSALHHLLDVCESELQYLDMSISTSRNLSRVGPRHGYGLSVPSLVGRLQVMEYVVV